MAAHKSVPPTADRGGWKVNRIHFQDSATQGEPRRKRAGWNAAQWTGAGETVRPAKGAAVDVGQNRDPAGIVVGRDGGASDRTARGGPRRKRAGWNASKWTGAGETRRKLTAADRDQEIRNRRAAGESVRAIAAALDCGTGTVARALKS